MKSKKFIKCFSFSTAKENRESFKFVRIAGRMYAKYGIEQAITLVGNLFKFSDEETNKTKEVLYIGMSRQHPKDDKCDLKGAYGIAQENAFINPVLVYYLQDGQNAGSIFNSFAKTITESMEKEFIYTSVEKNG